MGFLLGLNWGTTVPTNSEGTGYENVNTFTAATSGTVTKVRIYNTTASSYSIKLALWNTATNALVRYFGELTVPAGVGWHLVDATPTAITSGTSYRLGILQSGTGAAGLYNGIATGYDELWAGVTYSSYTPDDPFLPGAYLTEPNYAMGVELFGDDPVTETGLGQTPTVSQGEATAVIGSGVSETGLGQTPTVAQGEATASIGSVTLDVGLCDTPITGTSLEWLPPGVGIVKDAETGDYISIVYTGTQFAMYKATSVTSGFSLVSGTPVSTGYDLYSVCQDASGYLHVLHTYAGGRCYTRVTLTRAGGTVTGWTWGTTYLLPARTVSNVVEGHSAIRVVKNGSGTDRLMISIVGGDNTAPEYRAQVCTGPLVITAASDFTDLSGTASAWTTLGDLVQVRGGGYAAGYHFKNTLEQYGTSGNVFVSYGPAGTGDQGDYGCGVFGRRLIASGTTWSVDSTLETLSPVSYESMCGTSHAIGGVAYFASYSRADGGNGVARVSRLAADGTFTQSALGALTCCLNGAEVRLSIKVDQWGRAYMFEVPFQAASPLSSSYCSYHFWDGASWTDGFISPANHDGGSMYVCNDTDSGAVLLINDASKQAVFGYLLASDSGGSPVTETGTGQTPSVAQGEATVTVSVSETGSGQSPTISQGDATVAASVSVDGSGQTPTVAQGEATVPILVHTDGQYPTVGQGDATASIPVSVDGTGQAPVAAQGDATAVIPVSADATGQTPIVSQGDGVASIPVSADGLGQETTVSQGEATASTGGPVTETGLGQVPTVSQGEATAVIGAPIGETGTGQVATVAQGDATVSAPVSVDGSGQVASVSQGDATVSASVIADGAGQSPTVSQGNSDADIPVSVDGTGHIPTVAQGDAGVSIGDPVLEEGLGQEPTIGQGDASVSIPVIAEGAGQVPTVSQGSAIPIVSSGEITPETVMMSITVSAPSISVDEPNDFQSIIFSKDLNNVFFGTGDFAIPAYYYHSSINKTGTYQVLFDDPHASMRVGQDNEFNSIRPQFQVPESRLLHRILKKDTVRIRGTRYFVEDFMSDGVGVTTVYLRIK